MIVHGDDRGLSDAGVVVDEDEQRVDLVVLNAAGIAQPSTLL